MVPLLGSRVRYQPCKAACLQGEGVLASAAAPQELGVGRTCPALPAACQHPGSPCSCSLLVQVPWLHMLYAAIGAIAFTLVS